MLQLTIWSAPPLLAIMVASWAYFGLKKNPKIPGVRAVGWLIISILIWSSAQLVGSLLVTENLKLLASKFQYFGIGLAPVSWFVFAITYSRRQLKLPHWTLSVLGLIPALTILFAFTNDSHQLIWSSASLVQVAGYIGLVVEHGTWFYIHAVYSYGLIVVATAILGFSLSQSRHHRKPLFAIIAAPTVVCAANLIYIGPWNPSPWFDITPLGFALASMFMYSGVLRYGLLDSIPVVRHRVVEHLNDGVVIVNPNDRIVDINPAAQELLQIDSEQLLQQPFSELVANSTLVDLLSKSNNRSEAEITLNNRAYDVVVSSLDNTDTDSELALVFRDITARRKAESDLKNTKAELEHLANTDPLTSLYNRRFFMLRLSEESERVRRYGSELSVLVFDLDFFKKVNDTYGHDAGDRVLQLVSRVTNQIKRITDVAARIGGEEFALLLPETGQQGAIRLAQRLRAAIEKQTIKTELGGQINVTTSIGVATVSQEKTTDNLLSNADKALYQAKNGGRNMVCFADAV